jgi:hypothetical protein
LCGSALVATCGDVARRKSAGRGVCAFAHVSLTRTDTDNNHDNSIASPRNAVGADVRGDITVHVGMCAASLDDCTSAVARTAAATKAVSCMHLGT